MLWKCNRIDYNWNRIKLKLKLEYTLPRYSIQYTYESMLYDIPAQELCVMSMIHTAHVAKEFRPSSCCCMTFLYSRCVWCEWSILHTSQRCWIHRNHSLRIDSNEMEKVGSNVRGKCFNLYRYHPSIVLHWSMIDYHSYMIGRCAHAVPNEPGASNKWILERLELLPI